ncbi:hypothetical protein D5S09_14200 [Lactobacillus sp. LMY-20]|nr:hypothetical protein [Lactobacillus sp. LMY-20]
MTIFDVLRYTLSKLLKWIIVGLVFSLIIGGLAYLFIPKKYMVTSKVSIASANYTSTQTLSIQKLVSGRPVIELVTDQLKNSSEFSSDADEVASIVGASVETGTQNVVINTTSTNPRLAVKVNQLVLNNLLKVSGNYVPGMPLLIYSKPKLNANFVYPNMKSEALAGFILGMVIAILVSVKHDFFSQTVKSEMALRIRLQLDSLGSVKLKKR